MEIKYKKTLLSYKYLVMFDLASHTTGVCLWSIPDHSPVETRIIRTSGKFKTESLYNELQKYFDELYKRGIEKKDVLVYQEAMPTQLRGGSSTIQTFVALAKSHAILNLFLLQNEIDFYDDVGVYPASTHAYFKRLVPPPPDQKGVDKDSIRRYVLSTFPLEEVSLDESDAVFLAMTFVDIKWNNDIDAEVREVKRHKRSLVSEAAKRDCDEKIRSLMDLKVTF